MLNFKKLGFRPHKIDNFPGGRAPAPPGVLFDASYNGSRKITVHGCSFSGWNSPVGRFLISEASTFTIDNGDEATYDGTLTFSSKQAKEERF